MTSKLDLEDLKRRPITQSVLQALAIGRGDHSVFAPSSAEMWMTCSGSLIANLLEEDDAGIDAATGTVAHGVGETWLKTHARPDHLVGEIEWVYRRKGGFFEISITDQMLDFVEMYYDWCMELEGVHYIETKVDFSDLTPIPNQKGTADHACCAPGLLTITDLKYGIGERVVAEWNKQLLLYAYGFFREWDWLYSFQRIVIRVCQPRLGHFDVWEVSRETLLEFADLARIRANAAWRIDAPRKASPKGCRWCKVSATCAAHYAMVANELGDDDMYDDDELDSFAMQAVKDKLDTAPRLFENAANAATLSTEQMAKILPYRARIESWLKDIDAELESRALAGETVPGYKLVTGRSHREFRDETKAANFLEEYGVPIGHIYKTELVSPAQAEELLRTASIRDKKVARKMSKKAATELLEGLVRKYTGRPTLAPLSDGREELTTLDEGQYDDVD